jgi:hypothetical protein
VARTTEVRPGDGVTSRVEDSRDLHQICAVIQSGHSVLVCGEGEIGKLANAVAQYFASDWTVAIARYKGSGKQFFKALAEALDVPTVEPRLNKDGDEIGEKVMTLDQLKEELLQNASADWLIVVPDAKTLTSGICFWLEDAIAAGVRVCGFAPSRLGRSVWAEMVEVELSLPTDAYIRLVMMGEAQRQGLRLSEAQFAALQPLAGRNPNVARKVIRNEALGIRQSKAGHSQYLDISPLVLAGLCCLGILRFIGLGTGDRALYIVGGIAMMAGLSLKYLGKIGNRRQQA